MKIARSPGTSGAAAAQSLLLAVTVGYCTTISLAASLPKAGWSESGGQHAEVGRLACLICP